MKESRKKQTRIIHGNTEIIVNELESKEDIVEKAMFKSEQKKVAIRIEKDIYNFILENFGERGFSKFYHTAAKDLINKMKKKL